MTLTCLQTRLSLSLYLRIVSRSPSTDPYLRTIDTVSQLLSREAIWLAEVMASMCKPQLNSMEWCWMSNVREVGPMLYLKGSTRHAGAGEQVGEPFHPCLAHRLA